MNADLSFIYIVSNFHKEARIIATTNITPQKGEPTSDFLGFYGFGSGEYLTRDTHPLWEKEYDFVKFPSFGPFSSIEERVKAFNMGRYYLNSIVSFYREQGYLIDVTDILRFIDYLKVVTEVEISDTLFRTIKDKYVEAFSSYMNSDMPKGMSVVSGVVIVYVDNLFETSLCFGGPKLEESVKDMYLTQFKFLRQPVWSNINNIDFSYSTQSGGPNQTSTLLHSIARYNLIGLNGEKFDVKRLADTIQAFYPSN